jgi:hypothetical protein
MDSLNHQYPGIKIIKINNLANGQIWNTASNENFQNLRQSLFLKYSNINMEFKHVCRVYYYSIHHYCPQYCQFANTNFGAVLNSIK